MTIPEIYFSFLDIMGDIKCLENYKRLKELLSEGEKGNAGYFSARLNISTRTFFRLIKYLHEIEGVQVFYDKNKNIYYLE